MSADALLSANALTVGYRKKIIAGDFCFTLQPGQILTIIGPNGAGKSTLLKTIAAQLPAISGNVAIYGKEIAQMREKEVAQTMSVLLTEHMQTERMTCGDVAAAGRYPYTGTLGILSAHDKEIVQQALKMTGSAALFDRPFQEISDGQRQCVMLAKAIAQEPDILLLDEPTSFLDLQHKLHMLTLLRRLIREKNIAVLQTLHELDLAQKFSDVLLCVKDGKADRYGTPDEIFSGDYIMQLYGISSGSYNTYYGTAEPPAVSGKPRIFVISGGGTGIPVFRYLQRNGIPFAVGILHENDLDYPAAKALAACVIAESAYEPIADKTFRQAQKIMAECEKVICCLDAFGTYNHANEMLCQEAKNAEKLTERTKLPEFCRFPAKYQEKQTEIENTCFGPKKTEKSPKIPT